MMYVEEEKSVIRGRVVKITTQEKERETGSG